MADLRFGSFLSPNILPVYEAVAEAVEERLEISTELAVERSYEKYVNDVNDISFICSLPYITFERDGIAPAIPVAAPVLAGDRYRGSPIYYSDVIVHRDSPFQSLLDLRGHSWAYNEPLSQSGCGITRHHLLRLGETGGFFSHVVASGFHQRSLEMVRDRKVDGSAIDSQVLEVALRDDPQLGDSIRVIDSLGPSTIQPIMISRRLTPEMREQITDVILGLHGDPRFQDELDRGVVARFVPVGPETYDDIRGMLDACEAAGFTELR